MKANELMIGDWVQGFVPDTYSRVEAIPNENRLGVISSGGHYIASVADDFQPIPLTPEILEKNGFKFDGSGQRSMMLISTPLFSEGIRYNIYVGLKKKTIEVFVAHPIEKSPNRRKSNKVYLEVCGCYVHELQHALRLCGIEKEIIL